MKAIIIYGPSGSGKSTKVKEMYTDDSFLNTFIWIERDDIRFNKLKLGDWTTYKPHHTTENLVDAHWKFLLVRSSILEDDVIISDTLCKANERKKTIALLKGLGYTDIQLIRMSTTLDECIKRDKLRGNMSVSEDIIRKQWEHFTHSELM